MSRIQRIKATELYHELTAQLYYDLTFRLVFHINDKGLEMLSENTGIPFDALKEFKKYGDLEPKYVYVLYNELFQLKGGIPMTFTQAIDYMGIAGIPKDW